MKAHKLLIVAIGAVLYSNNVLAEEPNAYDRCMRSAVEQAVNPWQLKNFQDLCATDHPKEMLETFQKQMKALSDALCAEDPQRWHCRKDSIK
jgi:hypothetical protein